MGVLKLRCAKAHLDIFLKVCYTVNDKSKGQYKMKIGIFTLGCRVNQYESDAISELLINKGHNVTSFDNECDVCIINTCTVTAESDSKCRKLIRRVLRTGIPVAVIGCFVQGADDEAELEQVNYISGNRNKGEIVDYIDRIANGERIDRRQSLVGAEYEGLCISAPRYVKAYVKIEDGCNNFCSYCYVPFVRGRVRSRDEEDIISEIKRLNNNGYREIILTGIETSAYGEDRGEGDALCKLVERIQKECPVERLRFGSLNPLFFTEDNVRRLAEAGVMPHFHLSVQSASSRVLEAMKRRYTATELYSAVERIRRYFPDVNLSCDMICGFPGETDGDFAESIKFIEEAQMLHTHVFQYSDRKGTVASRMTNALSDELIHRRADEMNLLAAELHKGIFRANIGKEYNVLVEFFKGDVAFGYTENYINLRFPREGFEKGDIRTIKISEEMDNLS